MGNKDLPIYCGRRAIQHSSPCLQQAVVANLQTDHQHHGEFKSLFDVHSGALSCLSEDHNEAFLSLCDNSDIH